MVRLYEAILFALSGFISYFLKFHSFHLSTDYELLIIFTTLSSFFVFPILKLYDAQRGRLYWDYVKKIFFALSLLMMLAITFLFFFHIPILFSRFWIFLWFLIAFVLILLSRMSVYVILALMRFHGLNQRRVIIIGSGRLSEELVTMAKASLYSGFEVVAIYDESNEQGITLTGSFIQQLKTAKIDEVWLALPAAAVNRQKQILQLLKHENIAIRQFLDIYTFETINSSITQVLGFPVLNVKMSPMIGWSRVIKAVEDRLLAFIILLLISPLMMIISLLIKCTSKGPIFYKQKRVSWNSEEFNILKFRSMVVDAETHSGAVWAKPKDSRTTKFGAFLRRTSLDELPQFLNVLKGDMSIVGPRPERPEFIAKFKEEIPQYMQKHLVKAGITGWAQVQGWRGNTDLQKRIQCDLYYIEHWSLMLDLKIIFLTVFKGFMGPNAY